MIEMIEKIKQAFCENKHPADNTITIYNKSSHNFDRTYQILKNKTWQDCPVEDLMRCDTPVEDLTPEAFHYFMPAFLIESLKVDSKTSICDVIEFWFSPSMAQRDGEFSFDCRDEFYRRMLLFNSHQKEVIIEVLEYHVSQGWSESNDIEEAVIFLTKTDIR
jgi:hypothetical protein